MKLLLLAVAVIAVALIDSSNGSPSPRRHHDDDDYRGGYRDEPYRGGSGGGYPDQPYRGGSGGGYPDQPYRGGSGGGYPDQPYRGGSGGGYRDDNNVDRNKEGANGGGNTAVINGGEFSKFQNIQGRKKRDLLEGQENREKREEELVRMARSCKITGGDFSGLSYEEKAKLRRNCKVVGGYFGSEANYRGLRRVIIDNEDYERKRIGDKDVIIFGGDYAGEGMGEGSLSDITGAKHHVVQDGEFASFGDVKG